MIGSSSQCENHISRRFDASVSPDKSPKFFSFLCTLVHSSELRSTDSGFHPCRTHRSRSDADFDAIGSSLDQCSRRFSSDDIACNHHSLSTELLSEFFNRINHGLLISMRSIQNKCPDTHVI